MIHSSREEARLNSDVSSASSVDPPLPPPPAGSRPDPVITRRFWVLMVVSLVFVGSLAYLQFRRVDEARFGKGRSIAAQQRLPIIGEVPDFKLIDQTGRTVTRADLIGKVWVADFIFTTCGGPCPIMTQRMRELHQALFTRGAKNVVTVSFTVDPETDTPPVLLQYARQFNADAMDWIFLTGDTLSIYDLSRSGFKLPATRMDEGEHQVEHSPRFVLIDHRGQIRGYYEIITDEEMAWPRSEVFGRPMPQATRDRLLADIMWLLREVNR
ncbi:MAG: SCO family protein [Phycisphaerae bacterium]|nr:SCO family protein [Phycisphaerae bacterium]